HDEFFLDEIERARKRKRFLTGDELLIYVRDFLAENHKGCRLRSDEGREGVLRLLVTDQLRQVVRAALPAGDREGIRFLGRCAGGDVLLTTSPEIAEGDTGLELLSFYHPLVRAVHRHYEDRAVELHPISHVRLRSSEVPEGVYAWLLYSTEIGGARPARD